VRPLPATASTDAGDEDGGDATAARTPSGGRGVGPLLRKVSGRLTARVPASSAPRGPAGVHPSVEEAAHTARRRYAAAARPAVSIAPAKPSTAAEPEAAAAAVVAAVGGGGRLVAVVVGSGRWGTPTAGLKGKGLRVPAWAQSRTTSTGTTASGVASTSE